MVRRCVVQRALEQADETDGLPREPKLVLRTAAVEGQCGNEVLYRLEPHVGRQVGREAFLRLRGGVCEWELLGTH
eukprot:2470979-Alexandrium_andersonii.AAC.1